MSITTELFKILRSSSRKWAVKIENFEKKNLGWSEKQHGTFSGSKLLVDSKNVHVLYVTQCKKYNISKNLNISFSGSATKKHEFLCKKSAILNFSVIMNFNAKFPKLNVFFNILAFPRFGLHEIV
jgi:hypothetical protein